MGKFYQQEKALTSGSVFGTNELRGWGQRDPKLKDLIQQFAGTVFAAARRNADKVTSTKLRLYRPHNGKQSKWQTSKVEAKALRLLKENPTFKYLMMGGQSVEEVTNHPILDLLLKKPNPFLTGRQSLYYAQLYLQVAGIAYWRITRNKADLPVELYILPPHSCEPIKDQDGNLTGWSVGPANDKETLAIDEITYQAAENLIDPYGHCAGISAVRAVYPSLQLQDKVLATLNAIMENEGRPAAILTPKGENSGIGEDEAERWRRRYRQFMRGGSGDIMVLGDDATYTPLTYKPTDLAIIEISDWIEKQVAKAFGIPIMILKGEGINVRAAYQAAVLEWVETGINARLRANEDWINYNLLPMYGDEGLFVCYDDASPQIEELTAQVNTAYVNARILTPNDVRIELGYPETDWGAIPAGPSPSPELANAILGDVAEDQPASPDKPASDDPTEQPPEAAASANVAATALNGAQIASLVQLVQLQTTGQLPPATVQGLIAAAFPTLPQSAIDAIVKPLVGFEPEAEGSPQEEASETPEQEATEQEGNNQNDLPQKLLLGRDAPTGQGRPALILPSMESKKAPSRDRKHEAQLAGILRKHFGQWKGSVIGQLEKAAPLIETKGLPDRFIPLHELQHWKDSLAKDCSPVIEVMFHDSGKALLQRVGASPNVYNVFNHRVEKWAKKAALNLADSTLATTSKDINAALEATRQTIAEGLTMGDSVRDLKNRVGEIFDSAEEYRSERIAATESARAHSEGLRESAKDSGVVAGFTWEASSDPCPLCQDMDGKDIDIDGDMPPAHPLCECACTERISGIDEAE